jgi:hypothetical protein
MEEEVVVVVAIRRFHRRSHNHPSPPRVVGRKGEGISLGAIPA